ncbi:hypothetical protein DV113_004858 [Geotrichum candidum]|nr:hypothetical protein DV452_004612 [Geotrichum candidum]KAF7497109.1 hypothetical protein DV113_004858 [Geotrichum candidum]KAI8132193.1 hypothetical protein DUD61_004157 [Geotrichum candidum]
MDSKPSDLPSSILRGSLLMKLTKPTKIKDISVRFYGKCKTDWLESNIEDELMLGGSQVYDEVTISSHSWKYVNTPLGSTDHSSIVTIGSTSVISTNLFGADVVQFQPTTKKASVVAEASTKLEFKKKNPDHDINLPLFTPNYFQPEKTKTGVHPDLTSVVSQGSSTVYPAGHQNFLRPDVVFNPLIHVKHRLHVSFRISKQESYDPERKYYEVLVDVPIHFLSPHCKAGSIQLPQYVEFYDRTASLPTAHDDRYAPNEDVEAEFGQPLVHALSSQLSRSSELSSSAYAIDNFPYIDFIPPDDDSMLPSFDLSQEIQRRRASSTTRQCQPNMIFLSPQQLASRQRRESSSSESSVFTSSDESIINDTPPNYNSVVNQTNLMSSVMGQVSGS